MQYVVFFLAMLWWRHKHHPLESWYAGLDEASVCSDSAFPQRNITASPLQYERLLLIAQLLALLYLLTNNSAELFPLLASSP